MPGGPSGTEPAREPMSSMINGTRFIVHNRMGDGTPLNGTPMRCLGHAAEDSRFENCDGSICKIWKIRAVPADAMNIGELAFGSGLLIRFWRFDETGRSRGDPRGYDLEFIHVNPF